MTVEDYQNIIATLPEPAIFKSRKIEDVIAENVKLLQNIHPNWVAVESDANMMQLEALSHKELVLITQFNNAIKAMLPHYASDDDLDNFVFGFYGGETRHLGSEPIATYEFSLEDISSVDITIPQGLILSDGANATSYVVENSVIKQGELSTQVKVRLNGKIKDSKIKTETIISPYPYIVSVKAISDFTGGSSKETNIEFILRSILSLYQYSTAGSQKAYEYFVYKADERVQHCKVLSPSPCVIDIVIKATTSANEVVEVVNDFLNDEKKQCFTDVVSVRVANIKEVTISPTIHLIDILSQDITNELIKSNFNKVFYIDEDLPYSKIIKACEVQNVYKVELELMDLTTAQDEVLQINFTPTYVGASL